VVTPAAPTRQNFGTVPLAIPRKATPFLLAYRRGCDCSVMAHLRRAGLGQLCLLIGGICCKTPSCSLGGLIGVLAIYFRRLPLREARRKRFGPRRLCDANYGCGWRRAGSRLRHPRDRSFVGSSANVDGRKFLFHEIGHAPSYAFKSVLNLRLDSFLSELLKAQVAVAGA
jgi:hypothetical protein